MLTMEFRLSHEQEASAIEDLFYSVFSNSEGPDEGKLIQSLTRKLLSETDRADLYSFVAIENETLLGAILFSRLTFTPSTSAFILAPVAVSSDRQGQGIGQKLIQFGLQHIQENGVAIAITYGDPRFYEKVGFTSVSEERIQPPFKLSQPEGWLGQTLNDTPLDKFSGKCSCVSALSDPVYW